MTEDALEHTDPKLEAYREQTDARLAQGARVLRTLKAAVGLTLGALGLIGGYTAWMLSAAAKPSTELSSKLERHLEDSAQAHRQMAENTHELQVDVRALYKATMTGRPQARLERPPDGGEQ